MIQPQVPGALCGEFNERSGVVNIGIEGMMLFGAYVAFMVALVIHGSIPTTPSSFFGVTPALIGGVIAAIAAGLISLLHAGLSISIRADQIISGTIINITALAPDELSEPPDQAFRQCRHLQVVQTPG